MAESSNFQMLRSLAPDLIDKNGNFRTIPIGTLKKRNLSETRLNLLKSIYTLIRAEGFLNEESVIYIFDPYITASGINKQMNEANEEKPNWDGKKIPLNTTHSRMSNDRKKLNTLFGGSIITDIVYKSQNHEAIAEYSRKVAEAYAKQYSKTGGNEELRDNLALNLSRDVMCSELSSDKFDRFIELIKPYIKEQMRTIAEEMDKDMVGYFNYLLYSPVLSDKDKTRLDNLKIFLNPNYEPEIEIE